MDRVYEVPEEGGVSAPGSSRLWLSQSRLYAPRLVLTLTRRMERCHTFPAWFDFSFSTPACCVSVRGNRDLFRGNGSM
jgi:hypothetical protein